MLDYPNVVPQKYKISCYTFLEVDKMNGTDMDFVGASEQEYICMVDLRGITHLRRITPGYD